MGIATATAIADAILALNNSKPRLPTKDELVAAVLAPDPGPAHAEVSALRAEWDEL